MAQCPSIPRCSFLVDKLAKVPAAFDMIKKRYCSEGRPCARHLVLAALGREKVPPDLFPHEMDRAKQLLGRRY